MSQTDELDYLLQNWIIITSICVTVSRANTKQQKPLKYLISSFQFGVKLTEDLFQFFTNHVGQNIQTTPERRRQLVSKQREEEEDRLHINVCVLPVRHAHDDVLHTLLRGFIDDGLQSRDQRLAALQTKTFLCRPLLLQELLKPACTHTTGSYTHTDTHTHTHQVRWRCVYLVERTIRASSVLFSSRVNCITPGVSNFCLIHWHCSRSLMNMNSTPMCWQYDIWHTHTHTHTHTLHFCSWHQRDAHSVTWKLMRTHQVSDLQSPYDLFERQRALWASDEGGGGQPEHLVQVWLIQAVEAYMSHDAPQVRK